MSLVALRMDYVSGTSVKTYSVKTQERAVNNKAFFYIQSDDLDNASNTGNLVLRVLSLYNVSSFKNFRKIKQEKRLAMINTANGKSTLYISETHFVKVSNIQHLTLRTIEGEDIELQLPGGLKGLKSPGYSQIDNVYNSFIQWAIKVFTSK